MTLTLYHQIAIATGLGLLVGMQRQWAGRELAGIRTFPLITLFGLVLAVLGQTHGGWLPAIGLLGIVIMLVVANMGRWRIDPEAGTGITTEVAAVIMFGVGAAVGSGYAAEAVVLTGIVAVLLHWKDPLHAFVTRIGEDDFDAIARFIVITLVILPVLPNQDYGPYLVLNPFEIWLMVVLIVGISMAGYVAFKLFGTQGGAVIAGVLGGLISSTATTVSYARRAAQDPARSAAAAVVVTLASVVVFARVLTEIAVVAPEIFATTAPPLAVMGAFLLLLGLILFFRAPGEHEPEASDPDPPSDLKAAILFGALYAAVLLAVSFAREYLGQRGLFAVAALSGLTDMDAITLSTAQLVKGGGLAPELGWRLILVGAMSNLVFKAGVVGALGNRHLRTRVFTVFGVALAGGVVLLLAWPT